MSISLNHYPQARMCWAGDDGWMPKSQVLMCCRPPKDAVVFVHGWGGDAGSTWEAFPGAVATMPETSEADVFLLDYPSTTSSVAFCSQKLRLFLLDLARDPVARIAASSLPASAPHRDGEHRYGRIVLVAHSMGAVISRRALLDLDVGVEQGGLEDYELARFRLLLFAPAHCGSRIARLIGSGLGLDFLPGATLVGAAASVWFSSLGDLEEGSDTLKTLAEDNARLREERRARNAPFGHLRAQVYHAHNDKVVIQNNFDRDPPFNPVMRRNHRSICKPADSYAAPVEGLRAVLSR
jgi:pimeloyl-ACP methyl ester carboxylesterase